jgi:hypothetical protein
MIRRPLLKNNGGTVRNRCITGHVNNGFTCPKLIFATDPFASLNAGEMERFFGVLEGKKKLGG